MTNRFSNNALKITASVLALSLLPFAANAAECFDRETNDPKAGNATAVIGPAVNVDRQNVADLFRPDSGDDMFTGDTVSTGDESHLQLKLCDWSTYTFSPNSESAISEFFNVEGAGRRRVVNFVRGGFRLSSGRDSDPDSTDVEIQETGVTMGVRGTNIILAELDGFIYALLEGPVLDNDGLARRGLVDFWRRGDRTAVEARLKRPGFVVRISPDGTISEPYRADAPLLRRIYEAFVPVFREEETTPLDYAGDPLEDTGQGAQEGKDGRDYADYRDEKDDEITENLPEQPSEEGEDRQPQDPQDPIDPIDPIPVPIGEILPLPDLDDFAGMQTGPDGHVFALAPAQLFIDSGTGPALADDGVALIQISVDWASRTLAPEALASFVRTDFSVSDPNDLTIDDFDTNVPAEIEDALIAALLNSSNIPFNTGDAGFAVFPTQSFTFTIRQGANDTVTADVDVDFTASDNQNNIYNIVLGAADLMFMPGTGDLAFFDYPLGDVATITELEGFSTSGSIILSGATSRVANTLGTPSFLQGLSYAQLVVDFDNQTVGGGDSFIAITAAADPAIGGAISTQYVELNQAVPFSSGLFNLSFYPLRGLSSDPNVQQGQAFIIDNGELSGDIAAIISDDNGNNLYTEVGIEDISLAAPMLATIAALDAQSGLIEGQFSQPAGATLSFAGLINNGTSGFADLTTAGGLTLFGDLQASIDINFANRQIGGGNSFIRVDLFDGSTPAFGFTHTLNAVSFDDAAAGVGVFGFDAGDFSGSNIDSALFMIRDNPQGLGAGDSAELFVNINDGAGGEGSGEIRDIPLIGGATPAPIP